MALAFAPLGVLAALPAPAGAGAGPAVVANEGELREAWADPRLTGIELSDDIFLRACRAGDPIRESARPLRLDGNGHTIRQTCFEKRALRQDGTGFLLLEDIALARGGSDGPGAALTSRGEVEIRDSRITQNLAEEPGGGVFSMRRITVRRSVITGNLANDDGGGLYARRGGVQVYDSIVSANLVDGSGGAIGSTGDILVVDSRVDGNTTDGDGGALYTDEDGDVTVIGSTVDGNTADGPGGAIFTLDGDVTIIGSTLNGNRADDRGGAISGEADVSVIGSTIARNASVAHVGGGVWSRGDLYLTNSTIADNTAEGVGGGLFAAGDLGVAHSTINDNAASVAGNVAVGDRFSSFGSVIGPTDTSASGGQTPPTRINCRVVDATSSGYNFVSDHSCNLADPSDVNDAPDALLGELGENGGLGDTRLPAAESPLVDAIPLTSCAFVPYGYTLEGEQHLAAFGIDPLAAITGDQRGLVRPLGAGCDVGAVEYSDGAGVAQELGPDPSAPPVAALPEGLRAPRARAGEPIRARAGLRPPHRGSKLARLDARADRVAATLRPMERSSKRSRRWMTCVSRLPVEEIGDPDHRYGYAYDELDGNGLDRRPALAVKRPQRSRPDYLFLQFARRKGCDSAPTVPGGTAEEARLPVLSRGSEPSPSLGALGRRVERLERRSEDVERAASRFDRWESCLSWVPVTEYGDPDRQYGFVFGADGEKQGYRPALAIDRSEWDDPDYEFLAFAGRDRPFKRRECGNEPGEGVDRALPHARRQAASDARGSARDERLRDVRQDLDSLAEEVEDLLEPAEEFELFDQCMFTVGVSRYGTHGGEVGYEHRRGRHSALAMDMRGFDRARYDLLAFPGEEPPQIECNEDAGGQGTDE